MLTYTRPLQLTAHTRRKPSEMTQMFDQLHPVVEIIRTAYNSRETLNGIKRDTFERLYLALATSDPYGCENFLQRLYDDI